MTTLFWSAWGRCSTSSRSGCLGMIQWRCCWLIRCSVTWGWSAEGVLSPKSDADSDAGVHMEFLVDIAVVSLKGVAGASAAAAA